MYWRGPISGIGHVQMESYHAMFSWYVDKLCQYEGQTEDRLKSYSSGSIVDPSYQQPSMRPASWVLETTAGRLITLWWRVETIVCFIRKANWWSHQLNWLNWSLSILMIYRRSMRRFAGNCQEVHAAMLHWKLSIGMSVNLSVSLSECCTWITCQINVQVAAWQWKIWH